MNSDTRIAGTAVRGLLAVVLVLIAGGLIAGRASAHVRPFKLPKVKHVFVIVLENQSYETTFGSPADDPYLAQTLPAQGALMQQYFGTGHESADNYISLVSGQPPNPDTQGDCQQFDDFVLASEMPGGIEGGIGCVYPANVANIGTQLSAAGLSWKAYMQDMGNDPARESAACGHPGLGEQDETQKAESGDGYATRHNPFVYFHSVIDDQSYCDSHVVALGSPTGAMPAGALAGEAGLATDLKKARTTPSFVFITPNLCQDGHDSPCTNETGGPSSLANIDAFLETWVPKITSSGAFRQKGLLLITFDESEGPQSDSSSCCEEMPGPNSPLPGITGPGGGRIGAVALSRFINGGTVSATPYNHYSALASFESLFGLPRLADAATVPSTFGADVFTAVH